MYVSQRDRALHVLDDQGTDTALGSGGGGLTSPVGIADGGTGQTSQTPAFDALSPTTTKGDTIAHNGSDNVRLAVGADGLGLRALASATAGVSWVAAMLGLFGAGSDGAVTFDGTNTYPAFSSTTGAAPNLEYTLTRDVHATDLTVSASKVLNRAGYQVYCTGTYTISGTDRDNGAAANVGTAGAARTAANSGTTAVGQGGGAAGRSTAGTGAASGGTTAGAVGGLGGAGGSSGLGEAGGASGTDTSGVDYTSMRTFQWAMLGFRRSLGGVPPTWICPIGGLGGGAGGCDVGGGAATSGGGGAGGGLVVTWARYVAGTGTVQAKGGAGGTASSGGGSGGGGGGGGGGGVLVVTTTPTSSYTVDVTGGAGGSGSGSGVAGSTGVTGWSAHWVV